MLYRLSFVVLAVFSFLPGGSAYSQATWTGASNNLWGTGANWSGAPPASSSTSGTLTFNAAGAANLSNNNDLTDLTVGGIAINNSSTAGVFSLAGNQITLGGNITSAGATGAPTHTIGLSGLVLNGDRTISPVNNNNLIISSLISETGGSRSLIKNEAGTITLSNTGNSFTGAFSVNRAFVNVSSLQPSGTNSSIGAGNLINFGSPAFTGTISFTGSTPAGGPINRTLNLADGNGARIDNNGSVALTFNGNFTNAGTGGKTFTLGGSNNLAANDFQSILTNSIGGGALGFTKIGSGTWTLSGANTYTGTTIVQVGTLNVSTIADSGSSNLGLGSTMRFGNTNSTGTLNYSGSGDTTARTVQIGNNNSTPAAADNGGATINNNGAGGALVFSAPVFNAQQTNATSGVGGNRILTLGGTNTAANEISGTIQDNIVSGTATGTANIGVTKANAGRWVLAGNNTYTGITTVSSGVLQLNSASALPGGIATTGGTSGLTLSGGVLGLGDGNFTRALGTGADQVQLTADLSGFAAYGADRIVNLGGASSAVTWGSGSFMTVGNNLILSNDTATHTLDFQNPVILSATRFFQVPDGAATVDARLSGPITGSTTFSKAGAGTLELSNTGNAWTGTTFIDSGTLRLGANNVLPGGTVEIKRGAVTDTNPNLDLNGRVDTIGGINFGHSTSSAINAGGSQSIIDSTGGGLLTLGGTITYRAGSSGFENGQATIAANIATGDANRIIFVGNGSGLNDLVISGAISGSGIITKQGSGVLLLSGANTYTGQLNLETGIVKLGASDTLPNASTNIIQLGVNLSTTSVVLDINGNSDTVGILRINAASGGNPAVAGLTHSIIDSAGSGVLTLGDSFNVFSGGANQYGQATISANLNTGNVSRGFNVENSTAASIDLLISGQIVGTNGFSKNGEGTLALSAENTFSGVSRPFAGVLLLQNNLALQNSPVNMDASSAGTISLDSGVTTPTFGALRGSRDLSTVITSGYSNVTSLTLNPGTLSTANDYTGVVSDGASGMTLSKTGGGTQNLGGANTYTGATTVASGTLALTGAGSIADVSAVNVNGATGIFDVSGITAGSETVGSLAGVAGSSVVLGAKTMVVGGDNTSTTFAGVASGTGGGLTKTGNGTMTLTGANTYTGATMVEAGALVVNGNNALATGALGVSAGGTLSGTGIIGGDTTIVAGGFINPGNSPGTLNFLGSLTLGGTAIIEISGKNPLQFDVLNGDGGDVLTFGGILALDNTGYFGNATAGDTIAIFTNWNSFSGSFASITGTDLGGGLMWDTSALATTGSLTVTATAVPEPTWLGLVAAMGAGMDFCRRRTKKRLTASN